MVYCCIVHGGPSDPMVASAASAPRGPSGAGPAARVRRYRPVTFLYRVPRWRVEAVRQALVATVAGWECMVEIAPARRVRVFWADGACTLWLPASLGPRGRDRFVRHLHAAVGG